MTRTPNQIMADFDAAVCGRADISPYDVLQDIFNDILDSIEKAAGPTARAEVSDYLTNHYETEG